METSHKSNYNEAMDMQVSFENTNPFASRNDITKVNRPGKRPRIMKPLYSARLS
ncbi:hypothetical protein [Dyadobacter luticola]|uniref:hypothetical protein n=1 Tax=Dyadobacter luticola TaxID=1979387 RepID=UPI001486588F|nr:hypothetical protein [Dyadobacter luticola]